MGVKVLALFNLKPETTVADYEAWAKTVDIPTVNGLGSIKNFEVHKCTGLMFADGEPPYAYFEILDISDLDQFYGEAGSETMQTVAATFQSMVQDLVFVSTEPL